MFKELDSITLYPDNIGSVKLYPSWYANESQTNREEAVSTIASLSYGNESAKNPQELYQRLKDLKHSSAFEFVVNHRSENLRTSKDMEFFSSEKESEMVKDTFCLFKLKIPIFVMRQIVRHRNHSCLEMSRRYVKGSKVSFEYYDYESDREYYDSCTEYYNNKLKKGMLAQDARRFIPVGAYTELFWMFNWTPVDGCRNFLDLRLDSQHTQRETFLVAQAMNELISIHQPNLFDKIHKKDF